MPCESYVKFFIVFFILETNLPQNTAQVFLTEANFNYTIAHYQVVFVAFLRDNSSNFWKVYRLISDEIWERLFYGNLYSAVRAVECPKQESMCKRYNIENDSRIKVFISGEEYDTLVGPITSESLLNFIDEYLSYEEPGCSGDGICNDLEEEEEEVEVDRPFTINLPEDYFDSFVNSTDIFNEDYVSTTDSSGEISVTEEPVVNSTSYETLGRSSNPEFSFEDTEEIDSVPEAIDSDGENSTESITSFSKANSMKRAADFVVLFSLLYYLYS